MNPTWKSKDGSIRLFRADCRDVLPLAERVETCITDPPYDLTANKRGGSGLASVNFNSPAGRARIGAGFMGKSWDGTGVAFDAATWLLVLDSLKPGAMLLAFGGTRTYHRMVCAIEDAGFEIRDCLAWLYGQGFPKSLDISKALDNAAGAEREVVRTEKFRDIRNGHGRGYGEGINRADRGDGPVEYIDHKITAPATDAAKLWDGWGTALKPAFEPITLAMKPLDGTFAENAQRHGVAGLAIDKARIPLPGGDDPRLGGKGTWGTGEMAKNIYGSYAGETVSSSPLSRWPANVVLDEEAGRMLDEQTGPQSSGGTPPRRFSAKTKNAYGQFSGQENTNGIGGSSGNVSRFFYCPKADETDRAGSKHPTVKPVDLMKWLCRLTMTPTSGTVLDPFMGTGTTLEACYELHRPFIGIEREQEYFDDAVSRAKDVVARYGLFG